MSESGFLGVSLAIVGIMFLSVMLLIGAAKKSFDDRIRQECEAAYYEGTRAESLGVDASGNPYREERIQAAWVQGWMDSREYRYKVGR